MEDIFITCDTCKTQYLGVLYDSKEKKGQYGKSREETYESQCTVCDMPVFTTHTVNL